MSLFDTFSCHLAVNMQSIKEYDRLRRQPDESTGLPDDILIDMFPVCCAASIDAFWQRYAITHADHQENLTLDIDNDSDTVVMLPAAGLIFLRAVCSRRAVTLCAPQGYGQIFTSLSTAHPDAPPRVI